MRKKILITGASSGIGKTFAYEYAKRKKDLLLVARNKKRLEEIKKDLEETHKINCEYFICDLSKPEEIKKLIIKIKNEKVDVLINNAGFGDPEYFIEADIKITEEMINVHVLATTLLSRAVIEQMIKRNKGTIINLASIAAFTYSSISSIIYNSTKRYIVQFSKGLQHEINKKKKNIKIQALCPGFTRTNFNKTKIFEKTYDKIPSFLFMSSEKVVLKSINALDKKKVVFIPGFKNKIIVFLLKLNLYR